MDQPEESAIAKRLAILHLQVDNWLYSPVI